MFNASGHNGLPLSIDHEERRTAPLLSQSCCDGSVRGTGMGQEQEPEQEQEQDQPITRRRRTAVL